VRPAGSCCDDRLTVISIWDWKKMQKVNKFSNENQPGSSISSVHFINEMSSSLMLTASSKFTTSTRFSMV
jgi:hypothetical protein